MRKVMFMAVCASPPHERSRLVIQDIHLAQLTQCLSSVVFRDLVQGRAELLRFPVRPTAFATKPPYRDTLRMGTALLFPGYSQAFSLKRGSAHGQGHWTSPLPCSLNFNARGESVLGPVWAHEPSSRPFPAELRPGHLGQVRPILTVQGQQAMPLSCSSQVLRLVTRI